MNSSVVRRRPVADNKEYKSPEELGMAVGQKIEELFGGLFDEQPAPQQTQPAEPKPARSPAAPQRPAAPRTEPARPAARQSPPQAPAVPQKRAGGLEELLDRIDALILDVEWEAEIQTIHRLSENFKDMVRFLPKEGHPRTIVNMNLRVLQRCSTPGVAPHPLMVQLLKDSVSAIRQIHASKGRKPPEKALLATIVSNYHQILPPTEQARPQPHETPAATDFGSVMGSLGGAVQSLEDISQRLARLLAVLRKGGDMPEGEIARRLGSLESHLADRVGKLSALHRELSRLSPEHDAQPIGRGPTEDGKSGPDGLLMVQLSGVALAIPSVAVSALYPLGKSQAEQFVDKATLVLANKPVPKLPLKLPEVAESQAKALPGWLIHVLIGGKEFFVLAERTLGYRRSPKGVNLSKEHKIKIGNVAYTILNEAAFH